MRARSQAAHLVADRLVLEPQLVQDLLQLLVVAVGHPDGLGQPASLHFSRPEREGWWTVTWNGQ